MHILERTDGGVPVSELCREQGMSRVSFYKWSPKYGGMDASMIAEMSIQHDLLNKALGKKR